MIPSKIAKTSEHSHQAAFFAYCAVAHIYGFRVADEWCQGRILFKKEGDPALPELEWIHAIHNQGHGDKIRGARAKAEGVRKGVADIFLPYPVGKWHGLYIEFKKPSEKPKRSGSKGGLKEEQIKFKNYVLRLDYGHFVAYSYLEAIQVVKQYINYKS